MQRMWLLVCHYWYFKDVKFKFELNVFNCNKCNDVLMTVYELKNIWQFKM